MTKRVLGLLLASMISVLWLPTGTSAATSTPAGATATSSAGWESVESPVLSLANAHTWVLDGQVLADGACAYRYDDPPTEIPTGGWVRQVISVDPSKCQQVMQEGTPIDQVAFRAVAGISPSSSVTPATSRRGAWQAVIWFDIAGLQLTADLTQIYWDYNGSTVSNGSTNGTCTASQAWWSLAYCYKTSSYPTGSYMGQTWSEFYTSFCLYEKTYVYYNYNRVWGHPDGTAAIAQSSNSVNACLPLHGNVYTGYN